MFLKVANCILMYHEPNNSNVDYFLDGHGLQTSVRELDLGAVVTSDLLSIEQVKNAICTAISVLEYRIIDIQMTNVM